MKRRIVWLAALIALGVLAALLLFAHGQSGTTEEFVFSGERDILRASLAYDEGLRTLRGTQTLRAENRTGADLQGIVLRLYMNGMEGADAAVSGVTVGGSAVPFAQDAEDATVVTIDYPWQSGEEIELSWTVMLKHAKTGGAAVITLPSLAMFENGAWRTDAYDALAEPSYSEAFDFAMQVDGKMAARMTGARDASFALLPGGAVKEKEVSGVRIRAVAREAGTARTLLAQAQAALESLNSAGIAYPYDTLTVAESDTGREDGVAFSGLIALDADTDKEQLRRRLTRLIARETFGIFVESDPWNAPWLSATLSSCAEMLAYRSLKGAAAYEERLYGEMELATRLTRPAGVCVGASTAHFGSDAEMTQVLRDAGAAAMLGIEQAVGAEAFVTALAVYAEENGGKTGSEQALCSALERATGSRWDGYISDMLAF